MAAWGSQRGVSITQTIHAASGPELEPVKRHSLSTAAGRGGSQLPR
jgi:hypothetical protein